MSKGISATQRAALEKLKEKGSLNIIEACAIYNYLHARRKNPSITPDNIWLWPSEPGQLTEWQSNVQSVYRMMRSLEKRGLVARILHRRNAVWWGVEWKEDKPQLILNPSHSWYDLNTVRERDAKIEYRTKGQRWVIHYPEPTYSQLRQQDRQKKNKMNTWLNGELRKRDKAERAPKRVPI